MSSVMGCVLASIFLAQLPTIEADNFSPAVQREALLATVRIINQRTNKLASGVVLRRSGPVVYILTAAHAVDGAEHLEVHLLSTKSFPKAASIHPAVAVLARSKDKQPDLALLRMVGYDGESDGLKIAPLVRLPDKDFKALSVGCGIEHAPQLQLETVQDKVQTKRPGSLRSATYFRTKLQPKIGRSGGPLLDVQGRILGICSGTQEGRGYYCHLEEIHQFLHTNGLGSLLQEAK